MTSAEAFSLKCCPVCGYRLMKVHSTGLVSCLSRLEFRKCSWHIRVAPMEEKQAREKLSRVEKRLAEEQDRINKLKEQYGS